MAAPTPAGLLNNGTLGGTWSLDPRRSSLALKTRTMWGLIPVRGVFGQVSGNCEISPDGKAAGTLTVKAASLDTNNARRDKHLHSADFFDSDKHPDITFAADAIGATDHSVTVTGKLTVRDQTIPLSFDALLSVPGDDEISLDAEIEINRSDLGMTWNVLGGSSMHNTLTAHAVLIRKK